MNPEDLMTALRDAIYDRIVAKKAAGAWTYGNAFSVERTWMPYQELHKMTVDHPTGKVYVVSAQPVDLMAQSRHNTAQLTMAVHLGFQCVISNKYTLAQLDPLVKFVGELTNMCRLEVDCEGCNSIRNAGYSLSFNRIEFMRDPEGTPYSFIMLRSTPLFEAYFTAYYNTVLGGYESTTSTTTTTTSTTTTTTTTT